MKFYETHFEEYIESNKQIDLHPRLTAIYKKFPSCINKFRNILCCFIVFHNCFSYFECIR